MIRKYASVVSIILFTLSLLWCSSCTKQVAPDEEEGSAGGSGMAGAQEGLTEEELEEARRRVEELKGKKGVKLSNIYFAYDDFSLSSQAKKTLVENAAWIISNSQTKIAIEGHCDERGTEEYNIALGERRAKSVKRYLINLGVKSGQVSTISYGEEMPADQGHNEEAWAKNRRGAFVIK
jgi:peptidoglycan-associated lipoprotein